MMSWPDHEPGSGAVEDAGTRESRDSKRDAGRDFLSVTVRIWVVTLFVLALPVLAMVALRIDPTEQVGTFAKQNCQSEGSAIQSARSRAPRAATVSEVADRTGD